MKEPGQAGPVGPALMGQLRLQKGGRRLHRQRATLLRDEDDIQPLMQQIVCRFTWRSLRGAGLDQPKAIVVDDNHAGVAQARQDACAILVITGAAGRVKDPNRPAACVEESIGGGPRLPASARQGAEDDGIGPLRHVLEVEVPLKVVKGGVWVEAVNRTVIAQTGPCRGQVRIALEVSDIDAMVTKCRQKKFGRGVLAQARHGDARVAEKDRVHRNQQCQTGGHLAVTCLRQERLADAHDDTASYHRWLL